MKTNSFGILVIILISFGASSNETNNTIDREAVKSVIKNNLNLFKNCYEVEYRKNHSLEGKVVIGWSIDQNGLVTKTWVKDTKMNNQNVENCLTDKVKTLNFPKAPLGTVAEVQYPFVFQKSK